MSRTASMPATCEVDSRPPKGAALYAAANGAIEAFIKAISQKLSMRSIGSDARFDAIIEHARAETGEVKIGSLVIEDLWSRATAKGAGVGAGYMKITNNGTTRR